jgi:hypothetical protein
MEEIIWRKSNWCAEGRGKKSEEGSLVDIE